MAHVIDPHGVDLGDIQDRGLLAYYQREPGYTVGGVTTPANPARSSADILPVWAANTIYVAGQEILDPTGVTILVRQSTGTSRSTYDTTEQAAWSAAGGTSGASGVDDVATVASSGTTQTLTLPAALSKTWDVTLTGNLTPTFAGATAGKACVWSLIVRQDGTGSRLVNWPVTVAWQGGSAPTLSTSNAKYDLVQLVSTDGGSTFSGFATIGISAPTVPGQPSGVVATPGSTTMVLTWLAPAAGGLPITAYKVYRSTSTGTETLLTTLGNVLTFTDTGLTSGVTYYYKISAVNAVGEGTLSVEASASTSASAQYLNTASGGAAKTPGNGTAVALLLGGSVVGIRAKLAPTAWTPGANGAIAGVWGSGAATNQAWLLYVDTAGKLNFGANDHGFGFRNVTSSVATGLSGTQWVRADATLGGGLLTVLFYTSPDGSTWTQLGTTQTVTFTATTFEAPTTVPLTFAASIDQSATLTNPFAGHHMHAEFRNNLGGASVLTVDIPTQAAIGGSTFTDSASQTWTVVSPATIV